MSMGQPVAAISDRAPATFLMDFALSLSICVGSAITALFQAANCNIAC